MIPEAHQDAVACFRLVGARQPDVAQVWSGLAMAYIDDYAASFCRGGDAKLDVAREATAKALRLDRDDFLANLAVTRVQFFDGDAAFRASIDRAIELRPNSAQAFDQGGFLLVVRGNTEEGLPLIETARELSISPSGLYHLAYAVTYLREHRFAEAFAAALKVEARNWVVAQAILAAAASHSGRDDVARQAASRIGELYPLFEAEALGNFERWRFDAAFHDVLVTGLEAAGLDLRDPIPSGS
jgi:tetratricopeptide (TPR) repeat protein